MNYDITISGIIGDPVCGTTAKDVRRALEGKPDGPVNIAFCSLGGSVAEGLEIYSMLKERGDAHAHALGMNASIATVIMQGCTTVTADKDALLLIHNAAQFVDRYEWQNKEQLQATIAELSTASADLATLDGTLAEIYSRRKGTPAETIAAQMKRGTWLTAAQAEALGIIDAVAEEEKGKPAAQAAALHRAAYAAAFSPKKPQGVWQRAVAAIKGGADPQPHATHPTTTETHNHQQYMDTNEAKERLAALEEAQQRNELTEATAKDAAEKAAEALKAAGELKEEIVKVSDALAALKKALEEIAAQPGETTTEPEQVTAAQDAYMPGELYNLVRNA